MSNEQELTVVRKLTKADLQCCNVLVVTFIKQLFKQRRLLNIGCLVEKVIHHIVLIWAINFNFEQVKQRSLKVCISWKVVRFLKFYIQHTSSNPVYHHHVIMVSIMNFSRFSKFYIVCGVVTKRDLSKFFFITLKNHKF